MVNNIYGDTISSMLLDTNYKHEYMFYAYILARCNVKEIVKDNFIAGVSFNKTHYTLYINFEKFSTYPLHVRMGILKHETSHIIYNHVGRKGDRNHDRFNISSDCAINQFIKIEHLPSYTQEDIDKIHPMFRDNVKVGDVMGILPQNFSVQPCKEMETAEYYYELLEKKSEEDKNKSNSSSSENGSSSENPDKDFHESFGNSHDVWEESEGDAQTQQEVTKQIVEKAKEQTEKSSGNLPKDIVKILELLNKKPDINWRKVLKKIISSKSSSKKATLMRKSRRFHNRPEIKGKKTDKKFTLIVGLDVSGSMSDDEVIYGISEVKQLCKQKKINSGLIQIDTNIKGVQELDKKNTDLTRLGAGGTYMGSCPKYILDNKIECDVLVMISDMYIEDIKSDENWKKFNKPVIWLNVADKEEFDFDKWNKHRVLKLKVNND